MNPTVPLADPNGPPHPSSAAPQPNPAPHIPSATPSAGAANPTVAPAPRRNRAPRGPIAVASSSATSGASAMLELPAAIAFSTDQRRSPNLFVPDAQMLFHVLSICDNMMLSTDRFIRSAPAWLPIVSQLYISVLWLTMILIVYVNSGYGAMYSQLINDLVTHLRIDECLIPGPLVPFFQSLSAVNGPFEWIGDILPGMPDFTTAWNAASFHPTDNVVRMLPIPAIILDQLHYFATWIVPANETIYGGFEWYRNIFSLGHAAHDRRLLLGPQLCGSLYAPQSQVEAARTFWNSVLSSGITRTNAAAGQPVLTGYLQLFGFVAQNGSLQLDWFQHVATVMQKYTQYFNGSIPLKSILPVGIGATAVYGVPLSNAATRNWIYPVRTSLAPFKSSRFAPLRELPSILSVVFKHADHELEEQAEQYAALAHSNMRWHVNFATQHDWAQLTEANIRTGDYWDMLSHRSSATVSFKTQFAQLIASRFHQQAANRVD